MKTRIKVRRVPGMTFVEIPQPGMVVADTLADALSEAQTARGAYVKVQPTIRASERATVDQRSVKADLLAAGAVAVVVTPIVLPDARVTKKQGTGELLRVTPEEHLRQWLLSTKVVETVSEQALVQALESATEAGL